MAKRKRRSHTPDELESWREQMTHAHVAGYWASVGRLPPVATVRVASGCSVVLLGGIMMIAGIVGVLSNNPTGLLSELGGMLFGGVLLGIGIRLLRKPRPKRR